MTDDDAQHDDGDVFATAVARLDPTGRALYDELTLGGAVTAARRLLAMEAARLVDRLEHLDRVLDGDGETWAQISLPAREGEPLVLQVGNAMVEARQGATSLRQLLAQLAAAESTGATPQQARSGLDDLAARRAARGAAAAHPVDAGGG